MSLMSFVQSVYNAVQGQGGSGVQITRYPSQAASVALKASGKTTGAWKYAAANANVAAILAKGTITGNPWRLAWFALDTPSATSLFVVKLGVGAAAAGAFTKVFGEFAMNTVNVTAVGEYTIPAVQIPLMHMPFVTPDAATDGILGDMASSGTAADDTANVAVGVAQ